MQPGARMAHAAEHRCGRAAMRKKRQRNRSSLHAGVHRRAGGFWKQHGGPRVQGHGTRGVRMPRTVRRARLAAGGRVRRGPPLLQGRAQMAAFHAAMRADATVATLPAALKSGSEFGVVCTGRNAPIVECQEKPARPVPMQHAPRRALISMGSARVSTASTATLPIDAAQTCRWPTGHHGPREMESRRPPCAPCTLPSS